MQVKVKGNKDDISMLLVSAVRYALGRRTYIVQWTYEFVANNIHLLTNKDKQIMIRDIHQQKKYGYGDKCDEDCWIDLLKALEEQK